MNILHAIILGIVEGLTEFLPISSTAHLMIANRLLGLEVTDFVKSFDVIIQLGAILAVVVLYARRLLANRTLFFRVAVAFLPTALVGLLLYPLIKEVLLGNLFVAAIALIVGGFLLMFFGKFKRTHETEHISYAKALLVGVCQAIAVIPGVSRAAATIIGGQSLDIDRKAIVEFSFLLAIPTMAAATGLDLIKTNFSFSNQEWLLLTVGFVVAFGTALLAIKSFLAFIEKHSFVAFGWYRIAVGLAILLFLL